MSAGCSEVVIEHVSNLPSLQKSVMFLSALLFDIDSFSEVPVRDNLFNANAIFASSISKSEKYLHFLGPQHCDCTPC